MRTTTASHVGRKISRALATLTAALILIGVIAGCSDEASDPPELAVTSEATVSVSSVWDLIEQISNDPPNSKAKAQELVGTSVEPVTDYRFENTPVNLSDELQQVQLAIGIDGSRWTFTAINYTLTQCVTVAEVKSRYPGIQQGALTPPGPNAEQSWSLPQNWGKLGFRFSVASSCLVGLSLEPTAN